MKRIIIFYVLGQFILMTSVMGQEKKMQTALHGMHFMKGDISKELIIDDVRFEDGIDNKVDIIRFDNAGASEDFALPFIISSKEPIKVDDLGLIPLKLNAAVLKKLSKIILDCDVKVYERPTIQYGLIRVTSRFEGKLDQYYITDLKGSTKLFKQIERQLIKLDDKKALQKFYSFLRPSTLINLSSEGPIWKY